MPKKIGILTAGGDCPGLNAAIRIIGKTLQAEGVKLLGFRYGFEGMVENLTMDLADYDYDRILTDGGTILGTSRRKPHKWPENGKAVDKTDLAIQHYHDHDLDGLVVIGGNGTHKSAFKLQEKGLNIITLPKTIDNDLAGTDTALGFDSAVGLASQAVEDLRFTATSHRRIMVVELMGHRVGWLSLYAGLAGGADVILIPEIPYDLKYVAAHLDKIFKSGRDFALVGVAEGAISHEEVLAFAKAAEEKEKAAGKKERDTAKSKLGQLWAAHLNHTDRIAAALSTLTGYESRSTVLGYIQRSGHTSAVDRILALQLGYACVSHIMRGEYGLLMAIRNSEIKPTPIQEVAGKLRNVPQDHELIQAGIASGVCFGDKL